MSPLAQIFKGLGFNVSGSDVNDSPALQALAAQGITTFVGHAAGQLPKEPYTLVLSTAVGASNEEWTATQQQGYPVVHRSQLLQALFHAPHWGIAHSVGLCGTHGKTTLTGMVASVLQASEDASLNDPLVVVGGKLPSTGQNVRLSQSNHLLVAELDESDKSLLRYAPWATLLSNVELDHAEHYSNQPNSEAAATEALAALIATFQQFFSTLNTVPATTPLTAAPFVVLNAQCPLSRQVAQAIPATHQRLWVLWPANLGETALANPVPPEARRDSDAYFRLDAVALQANGCFAGRLYQAMDGASLSLWNEWGEVALQVPGLHNLHNAAQVAVLTQHMGVAWPAIAEGLQRFSGMGRRFERVGLLNGALLVDDYAHHPTEIEVTLRAAQALVASQPSTFSGRIWCVVQPHRYSRLQALWEDFANTLAAWPHPVYVMDVYAAHEEPIEGVTSEALVAQLQWAGANAQHAPSQEWVQQELAHWVQPGDLVLSLGAGDVTHVLRTHPQRSALHALAAMATEG
jgi:UDP-N-acetylmuramate--alanine ligase